MAIHTELEIFGTSRDLLLLVVKMVSNMRRDFKHDLGGELRRECVRVSVLIFRVNTMRNAERRSELLLDLIEAAEVIKLLLRIVKDLGVISPKHHSEAMSLTVSIGKQATGWRKKYAPVF